MKLCSFCKEEKPISDFYKNIAQKSGLNTSCKECDSKRQKIRRSNKDVKKAIHEWGKEYRKINKEKIIKVKQIDYQTNKEKYDVINKAWIKNNPDKFSIISKRANAKRLSTLSGRLNNNISSHIRYSLKRNNGSKKKKRWETLVGFNVVQLKKHLEKQFDENMTWENYGKYWHIDHEIPIAAFNFEKPEDEDFSRCWSLSNLRPLEAIANISKGAKITKPFQQSLIF